VIDDWALEIIRAINSYTEISPSGAGVRIFCYGKLPPGRRKNGNVEMYDESSPKYLTITGHHVPGTPRTLERRQTEIEGVHAEHLGAQSDKPINGNFSKTLGKMAWQLVECGHAIDSARDS